MVGMGRRCVGGGGRSCKPRGPEVGVSCLPLLLTCLLLQPAAAQLLAPFVNMPVATAGCCPTACPFRLHACLLLPAGGEDSDEERELQRALDASMQDMAGPGPGSSRGAGGFTPRLERISSSRDQVGGWLAGWEYRSASVCGWLGGWLAGWGGV